MIDYGVYRFCRYERFRFLFQGIFLSMFILFLFYQNLIICIILSIPGIYIFLKQKNNQRIEERKWQLTIQFKDAMEGFISALTAGYSMENAVSEVRSDLEFLYKEDELIMQELLYMEQRIALNESVEGLLEDLGRRSDVDDIKSFAEIYVTAQKSGGNLIHIMRRTVRNIVEKVEIQREIKILIAGKELENKCMMIIPLMMILYFHIFSPGYLDPLYHNFMGEIVMSGSLLAYLGSCLLSKKIMKIV